MNRLHRIIVALLAPLLLAGCVAPEPLRYAISFDPPAHTATVDATIPTDGRESVSLMMPVWSPGYYHTEDMAAHVKTITARSPAGEFLTLEKDGASQWTVATKGASAIRLRYTLECKGTFVTSNTVVGEFAVLCGPPTYIAPVDGLGRACEVRLDLPAGWQDAICGLEAAEPGRPNSFVAPNYDILADAPIVAGRYDTHSFCVDGVEHVLVDVAAWAAWDSDAATTRIKPLVEQHRAMMGRLPFRRYLFFNVFRAGAGGGGLEHLNSVMMNMGGGRAGGAVPTATAGWLKFVSHEYFHAFNVKRLRPVELGPFDYLNPPRTQSMWISEGWTTYYGDLAVDRSSVGSPEAFLEGASRQIGQLQSTPGRRVQSLANASLDVWTSSTSGVRGNRENTVDYYNKGFVAAMLLDAHVRRVTGGERSLDDVFRLAYSRYSGARGFTPEEFRAVASEVAGTDLSAWFHDVVETTQELDYTELLEWYGLRFATGEGGKSTWKLEVRPDARPEQTSQWQALFEARR